MEKYNKINYLDRHERLRLAARLGLPQDDKHRQTNDQH
jgi:hypothetical protein